MKKNTAELLALIHSAWQAGLFQGTNGNASLLLADTSRIAITRSGCTKGVATEDDISFLDLLSGESEGAPVSTEVHMHKTLYEMASCRCVLHTHPTHVLAVDVLNLWNALWDLPLYEARMMKDAQCVVPAYPPGTPKLRDAVRQTLKEHFKTHPAMRESGILLLHEHGLCTWGKNTAQALALTEQVEHLAAIELLVHHA